MFDPADTKHLNSSTTISAKGADRTLSAIVLLAIITLGASWALLPGAEEKAAGLFDDHRFEEALGVLEAAQADGPLSAYGSQMLFKLYVETQQRDHAAAILVADPALATDVQALRQVSSLFRQARDFSQEAAILHRLYTLSGDTQDFGRLKALYRLLGDGTGEASLLAKATSRGSSNPADLNRLIYLRSVSAAEGTAMWVAPTSTFATLLPSSERQALALSELPPLFKTTLE